jgi:hypothetical protein
VAVHHLEVRRARVCVPPRREVDRELLIADELDLRRGKARTRRLAAEHEIVHVGEVVDEQLVATFDEQIDVLSAGHARRLTVPI